MSKAKVIVKVGDDFFTIAQNVWKMFKGSKDVVKSSATAAKREGRTIRNASQSTIKNKAQLNKLSRANERKTTADALRKLGKESKVKLKKGPLDVKTTVRKPPASNVRSNVSGRRSQRVDKKDTKKVKPETISRQTRKGVVTETKIPKVKGKGGFIINPFTKKPFTTKAKWLAAGGVGSWAAYVAATSGSKKPNGAATTSSVTTTKKPYKKPSISGMSTTGGPPQRKPTYKKKPPKADYPGAGLTTTEDEADRPNVAKPKTFEQKLKDKWIKRRGGVEAFKPTTKLGKAVRGDISGQKAADSSWQTHVLNMREGSEAGLTYTDQQNYDKIIAERKELAAASKKKRGGVIKRNKGGPVRGVGKALRGYGNNSIYSNKMY